VLRGPAALGDRLTRQVHHPLGRSQGLAQGVLIPAGGICWIKLQAKQPVAGLGGEGLGAAAHQGDGVPQLQQEGHQFAPHEAGTSQQQQLHARIPNGAAEARRRWHWLPPFQFHPGTAANQSWCDESSPRVLACGHEA
jgi:hypothetical protein